VPTAAGLQPFRKTPEIVESAKVCRRHAAAVGATYLQNAASHLLRALHFAKRTAAPLAGGKPFG